jgi:hypothetical protein
MAEVGLFERFGVGAGCVNHDVVLNHVGVIRLQCSWRGGNSLSRAYEIHRYLWTGPLPLDLVNACGQLLTFYFYLIWNLYRVLILVPREGAHPKRIDKSAVYFICLIKPFLL